MASPAFRSVLKSAANQEVVVPALRAALWNPDFKGFNIEVQGFEERPADGWFWPSTHPTWSERALYQYLVDASQVQREPFDPTSVMAVTMGTLVHSLLQHVMTESGIIQRQDVCGCGRDHPEKAEVFFKDPEVGIRGHADGVVHSGDSLIEIKTMAPAKTWGIPKVAPDDPTILQWLRDHDPFGYYPQAQCYMRMAGLKRSIMLIVVTSYPFEQREIHVPYDERYADALWDKFRRVRQAVADQRPPSCECSPVTAKECLASKLCWGGRV